MTIKVHTLDTTCTNSFKCIFMVMGMITGLLLSTMVIG